MSDPVKQHDLPRTYLRYFAIDPNDRALKSLIYSLWSDTHGNHIKQFSIDSNIFKTSHFYTINHQEAFAFEEFLGKEIEPLYGRIMAEILSEKNLSYDCRIWLVLWLYVNKYRNRAHRANLERIHNFLIGIPYSMEHGAEKFKEVEKEVEKVSAISAKKLQLESLANQDLFSHFDKGMGTKHWMILKSRNSIEFLTNDNPGFSINMEMGNPDLDTLSNTYATNSKAWNYFVLSPKYCLLISPYEVGTPLDTSLHNQVIEFKTTNERLINFINWCTAETRTKYLISHKRELLIPYQSVQ